MVVYDTFLQTTHQGDDVATLRFFFLLKMLPDFGRPFVLLFISLALKQRRLLGDPSLSLFFSSFSVFVFFCYIISCFFFFRFCFNSVGNGKQNVS